MTDNAVLYAGRVDQCPFKVLGQLAPRAKARVLETHPDGDWAVVELKWSDLTITVRDRTYEDPEMLEGLEELAEWVEGTWTDPNEAQLHRLLHRLARTRRQINVIVEPDLDADGRAETLIFSLADPTYAVVLFMNALWDPDAHALMGADGKCADDAAIAYAPSARERRARTLAALKAKSVDVPEDLALLEGDEESLVTHPEDAAKRALALWALAGKAEGANESRWKFVLDFKLEGVLTEEELAFLESKTTSDDERAKYTWQYESAWALLWALGAIESEALSFPSEPCDPAKLGKLFGKDVAEFLRNAELRDVVEILDARDETYCLQWACLEALTHEQQPPAGLNSQVVRHRLRALNWLMMDGYRGWEDVREDA